MVTITNKEGGISPVETLQAETEDLIFLFSKTKPSRFIYTVKKKSPCAQSQMLAVLLFVEPSITEKYILCIHQSPAKLNIMIVQPCASCFQWKLYFFVVLENDSIFRLCIVIYSLESTHFPCVFG